MKTIVEKAIGDDGCALWEEKFPLKLLLKKREEAGSVIFGMQYQNDAELAKGDTFRIEWMRFHDIAFSRNAQSEDRGAFTFYLGVDPAISTSSRADYFALVTVGIERSGQIYVADTFRGRLSFAQQIRAIEKKILEFSPVVVGIESVAYQEVLAATMRSVMANLPDDVCSTAIRSVSQAKDKQTRALRLSALFENGSIYLAKNQNELLEELLLFPHGAHDDLLDALEIAVRISQRFRSSCHAIPGV
jgi:predicted phage terminase large subunit-like protein